METTKQHTAVLIHGYHLEAQGWEDLVWGDPINGVFGSIPQGVTLAYRMQANKIFWGTGASEKSGLKESHFIHQFALSRAAQLAQLCNCTEADMRQFLTTRSHVDDETLNTAEEVRACLDMCMRETISQVFLVAVATHAQRSLKAALSVILNNPMYVAFRHNVYAAPADTCFAGAGVEDVVIIEPPHRGDMPKWQTFRYARAIFEVLKQGEQVFETFLTDLGAVLKKYGISVTWPPRT